MFRCLYSHFYPDHPRDSHTYANVIYQVWTPISSAIAIYLIPLGGRDNFFKNIFFIMRARENCFFKSMIKSLLTERK